NHTWYTIAPMEEKVIKKHCKELRQLIQGEVFCDIVTRELYATDASMFRLRPDIIIYPKSEFDVVNIVKYAAANSISVTPRGAGTGLAGESLNSGIILDFSRYFNNIIDIDEENSEAIVQSGVVLGHLNKRCEAIGKHFGPDPATTNRCTIGGVIANNSTGAHSLRYGMTHDWVKELKVVLANGTVVQFNQLLPNQGELIDLLQSAQEDINNSYPNTPRNRHGYLLNRALNKDGSLNWEQLFCASEGTLGIILEAKVGLADLPESTSLVSLIFDDFKIAAKATPHILKYDPSAVEIIDHHCLGMARQNSLYRKLYGEEVGALLLVEFDDFDNEKVLKKIESISRGLSEKKLLSSYIHHQDPDIKKSVWNMRKLIAGMINRVPGKFQPVPLVEDVCVKPEKLFVYFNGLDRIFRSYELDYLCFGHAGDGTVHIRPFLDLKDSKTAEYLPRLSSEIYDLCLYLGGTISGEHGDGFLRAPFIKKQYPR
ncbi:MAG: FAD-binding oxidoreductase, partial [Bacteriovoracia bacterium]